MPLRHMSGPQFVDLADAAALRVLMAGAAAEIVIDRTQPVLRSLALVEYELVIFERAVRHRRIRAFVHRTALVAEPVENIVGKDVQVSSGSFSGGIVSRDGIQIIGQNNTIIKTNDTEIFRSFIVSFPLLRKTALAAWSRNQEGAPRAPRNWTAVACRTARPLPGVSLATPRGTPLPSKHGQLNCRRALETSGHTGIVGDPGSFAQASSHSCGY